MPATVRSTMPDSYFKLVRRFPLIRIASERELAAALVTIDDLLPRELDTGGAAYLDALSALIYVYETEHHSIPDATAAQVLRELADTNGLTAATIGARSGIVPSTVSALMSGKRQPTPKQMIALAAVFHVKPSAFHPTVEPAQTRKPRLTAKKAAPAARASTSPIGAKKVAPPSKPVLRPTKRLPGRRRLSTGSKEAPTQPALL